LTKTELDLTISELDLTESELDLTESELDLTESEQDLTESELDLTESELDLTESELDLMNSNQPRTNQVWNSNLSSCSPNPFQNPTINENPSNFTISRTLPLQPFFIPSAQRCEKQRVCDEDSSIKNLSPFFSYTCCTSRDSASPPVPTCFPS
jgi:hypothetical protein